VKLSRCTANVMEGGRFLDDKNDSEAALALLPSETSARLIHGCVFIHTIMFYYNFSVQKE